MAGDPSVLALFAVLTAGGRVPGPPAPILDSGLSGDVKSAVERSFPFAHHRIGGQRACGGLFARLGAEGRATLAATSYYPATPEQQRRHCHGTTHAFTQVGGTSVGLCPSFGGLRRTEAALILIHEALHSAGQTEFPSDPTAPDSFGITRMVMAGCGLF
jgi:hypothetical protein